MIDKNRKTRNSKQTYQFEKTYSDINKNYIISKIKTMGFKKKMNLSLRISCSLIVFGNIDCF